MKRSLIHILIWLTGIAGPLAFASTTVDLIVPIGGTSKVDDPTKYFKLLFEYAIGLAALLALAMLVYGAVQYTASAGFPSLQENAKSRIRSAIFGLVLLLASITILTTLGSKSDSNGGLITSLTPLPTPTFSLPWPGATQSDLAMEARANQLDAQWKNDPAYQATVTGIMYEMDQVYQNNQGSASLDAALAQQLQLLADQNKFQDGAPSVEANRAAYFFARQVIFNPLQGIRVVHDQPGSYYHVPGFKDQYMLRYGPSSTIPAPSWAPIL